MSDTLFYRCEVTGNIVGTDTRGLYAPPCDCQGCRADAEISAAHAEIERLARERDEARILAEYLFKPEEMHELATKLTAAESTVERLREALQMSRDRFAVLNGNSFPVNEDILEYIDDALAARSLSQAGERT